MKLAPTLAWHGLLSHLPILAMTVNAVIELRLPQVSLWWKWHLFPVLLPPSLPFHAFNE